MVAPSNHTGSSHGQDPQPADEDQHDNGTLPSAGPELLRDPATPKEQFESAMQVYLRDGLAEHYPNLFDADTQVSVFDGTGVTASAFTAIGKDAKPYFIKVRAMSPEESAHPEQLMTHSSFIKEARMTERMAQAGKPVTRVYHPAAVEADEISPELGRLTLQFGGMKVNGAAQPYIMTVQHFETAQPAVTRFQDQEFSVQVQRNFGKALSEIHTIPADGFGKEYDATQNSFTRTYQEFIADFDTNAKLDRLVELGILDQSTAAAAKDIVEPLTQVELDSCYAHLDPNPGNYLVHPDAAVAVVIDWDNSGAAPWQYDVAKALDAIEATPWFLSNADKAGRITAFLDGYGKPSAELRENLKYIEAFRVMDAVDMMYALFETYHWQHRPDDYKAVVNGSYNWTQPEGAPDYHFCVASFEALLRRSASKHAQD